MTAAERIRGGWIVTGECGRPHLKGPLYKRMGWVCPVCGWEADS